MKRTFLLSICLFLCLTFAVAQKESKDVRFGNKLYKQNKFTDAEAFYKKGLAKNNQSFEASFNLGDALYRQKKYTEAVDQFVKAASLVDDKKKIAAAYHNVGNAFFKLKELQKSIDAYKKALKNNPKDEETRYNLALAQKYLQLQQNQPQKQQEKISEENAEQLLEAILQDEKQVQEKVNQQQRQAKRPPNEKDW